MPKRRTLILTTEQRKELEQAARRHKLAYMRERAAALLKIADGATPHWVARHGLLQERDPDAVYGWLNRYEAEGFPGLVIRPGRGRKPSFSPSEEKGG